MENAKLKELINRSFLTSEQKRFLVQYIDLKGVDIKFFDTFSQYLREELQNQDKNYEAKIRKIDELSEEIDKRATAEKMRIEERLEQELVSIDPLDLKTRGRIWEEYYDALDELGERYNRGLRDALSKIMSSTV